jgi:hypothetical protein
MVKHIFARITKVDAENRLVYGVAAAEELDKSGEIFDYDGSKPFFEKWSESAMKMSIPAVEAFGPLSVSYGNVREMHTTKAAGKLSQPISFVDADKSIQVCSFVADDDAWDKVGKGVYTGFSIGGNYVKVWNDPEIKYNGKPAKRYTADPSEISLVDNPCMPSATFSYIAKGSNPEVRKFVNVELAEEQIPAEVARICTELATPETRKSATAAGIRLMKRAKELGVDVTGLAKAYVTQFGNPGLAKRLELAKSLYDVMDIAGVLMTLNYCRMCLTNEAEYEGDGSLIPARLTEVVQTLSSILVDLAAEESSELTAAPTTKSAGSTAKKEDEGMTLKFYKTFGPFLDALTKAVEPAEPGGVAKVLSTDEIVAVLGGAESVVKMAAHLKEIGKHVGNIRAAHSKMKKSLDELDPEEEAELEEALADADKEGKEGKKAAKVSSPDINALAKMQEQIDALTKQLSAIPAPSSVALNPQPVSKSADTGGSEEPETIDPKDPQAALKMMKAVHRSGPTPIGNRS